MTTRTLAHSHHHALPAWEVWLQKYRWVFDRIGMVAVGLAVLSVFAQLLYPAETALPFMKVGGLDVGGKDRAAIVAQLQEYGQSGEVTIASPNRQWRAQWQSLGLAVDAEASADVALSYQIWERFIPFSGLIRVQQGQAQPLVALVDHDRLDAFAAKLVQEDKRAAQDALVRVQDGKVLIDDAKSGYEFTVEAVKQQVQSAAVSDTAVLRLIPKTVPYTRSSDELAGLKARAEAMLTHQLTLKLSDKTYKPGPEVVGGWLEFREDPVTHGINLAFKTEEVKKYLTSLDAENNMAPGTSTVTMLDGVEISRTPAAGGRSSATETSLKNIQAALEGSNQAPTVTLTIADVPPNLTYMRSYSNSDAGLLAVIRDWQNDHSWARTSILVRELGGDKRYAEIDPDSSYVTASTFKLFVYYAVALQITEGKVSYGQRTDMGWTVEACLVEMITRSTNPCAISLMNLVGWQYTQDVTQAAGFTNTFVNNQGGGDKFSTVRDETNYFLRLQYGTLMAKEPTERLLGYLKRQIWRAGIPSGVPKGVVVADKVGFYNGWVHDIAIVYGPKTTYMLGVMSSGGTDPMFADLSRRVYNFLQN